MSYTKILNKFIGFNKIMKLIYLLFQKNLAKKVKNLNFTNLLLKQQYLHILLKGFIIKNLLIFKKILKTLLNKNFSILITNKI